MTVTERVGQYRARLRERGFRPVQIWVPDTRGEHFAQEAARQATLVATADRLSDDQDFVESISVSWED